jgi:hypothetical protein
MTEIVKLYKVQIEFDMVVVAADEKDAEQVAKSNACSELSNQLQEVAFKAIPVSSVNELPKGWIVSLPYISKGVKADEDTTCEEFLKGKITSESLQG